MNYGLDLTQYRHGIVIPALKAINAHSPTAENLVLGTALHESHLTYMLQLNGPALGLHQMEPATHDDIHKNFLMYKPTLRRALYTLIGGLERGRAAQASEMVGNMWYAAAMCRIHYMRAMEVIVIDGRARTRSAALPANEPRALAQYWKTYYNTEKGKGTVEQALPHFEETFKL